MYFTELKILDGSISSSYPCLQAEHGVHQYLHQAMGAIMRLFFEHNGLVESAGARCPQLMIELTCLSRAPLPMRAAMRLEVRLTCASEEGFSVDYSFHAESDRRLLAAWRSLHIFYDYASEQPLVLEAMPLDRVGRQVEVGTAQIVQQVVQQAAPQNAQH